MERNGWVDITDTAGGQTQSRSSSSITVSSLVEWGAQFAIFSGRSRGPGERQRATDWIENKGQVDGRAMSQDWCDELHKCRKASGNGSEWRRCWDCWHCAAEVVKAKGPKWPTLYHICICSVGAETLPRPVATTVIPWPTFTHWHVLFEKEASLFCNRMIYYRNLEEEKIASNNGKCLARVLFQTLTLIWALLSASHLTQ